MAKIPSFVTGANAKLTIDGKTFAYASEVSYNVKVDTIPVETMGRYEVVANEPVGYTVAGEFSIVRYTKLVAATTSEVHSGASNGNGLGNVTGTSGVDLADNLDPSNILGSSSWALNIYQKTQTAGVPGTAGAIATQNIINVTDCRITNKSGGLNKRGLWVERIAYVGILASDDSYTAANSGDIDLGN